MGIGVERGLAQSATKVLLGLYLVCVCAPAKCYQSTTNSLFAPLSVGCKVLPRLYLDRIWAGVGRVGGCIKFLVGMLLGFIVDFKEVARICFDGPAIVKNIVDYFVFFMVAIQFFFVFLFLNKDARIERNELKNNRIKIKQWIPKTKKLFE